MLASSTPRTGRVTRGGLAAPIAVVVSDRRPSRLLARTTGTHLTDQHAALIKFEPTNMPNSVPLPPPGFDDLSVDEQIAYVQSLWDRIAATPQQVPVPECEILDERLKDDEANPGARATWNVVRERSATTSVDARPTMERRWIVRPPAQADIEAAAGWYEEQQPGLGLRFIDAVDHVLTRIRHTPLQFPDFTQRSTCVAPDVSVRGLFPNH
jgi:putative addiction module component (TIGR02574 family)